MSKRNVDLREVLERYHFVEDLCSVMHPRVLGPFFPTAPPTKVEEIHPLGLESIYLAEDSPN
ncbi:hypothetical protein CDL15_Pgr023509 [Punica granatum]|nr:hypothetical protein CDL15_Pgr023509 [Punica granatum]